MMEKYFCKSITIFGLFFLITLLGCPNKSSANLPKDILGISVGMNKDDAQKRLQEIGSFERSENKGQEVWRLKDTSRFILLTVGYDTDNKIRFVAGVANDTGSQKPRYTDVGNLSDAKQNVSPGNYEYTWDVPASEKLPDYQVIAHGNKPDYSMLLTLKKTGSSSPDEDEDEDRERK